MLLKIAICDDEQKEVEKMGEYVDLFSVKNDVEFQVSSFQKGEDLLKCYGKSANPFDIILLDVEMEGANGIEVAEKIRKMPDHNVLIAFITSYPEYMQDSFDVQASQYFTKPLSFELFEEKLRRMINLLEEMETNMIVAGVKEGDVVLHLNNVLCFETEKSLTTKSNLIVTALDGELLVRGKMDELEVKLMDKHFIRVHRSVLVNMRYIRRFTASKIELANGKLVELSRRKAAGVKGAFAKFTVMRCRK